MAKRICMVAYTHYLSDARPRREAEALAARGDEVDFVALGGAGSPREAVHEGVRLVELVAPRYRGASRGAYLRSYSRFFLGALAAVTARHLRRRYDVVHVHTMPDFMVFTAAPAKLLGAKVVLDVHDTMPELYRSKFGLGPGHALVRALALQERLSCGFADRVICVHEPHKQLLVARGVPADKITVLLNVPDPRVFGPPRDGATSGGGGRLPRLVYHGTVAERLGLDVALRAFGRVLEDHPGARFDIIGTGDFGAQTKALIAELGLAGAVGFTDRHFPVSEVPELLADATVGVVPNRDDPATRLMLPVKLLEYVHLGIPAVAPRLPAIEHYFGEDAVSYYTPGDAASLAGALARVLDEPGRAAAQRHAAARIARRLSWDVAKNALFSVIDH